VKYRKIANVMEAKQELETKEKQNKCYNQKRLVNNEEAQHT